MSWRRALIGVALGWLAGLVMAVVVTEALGLSALSPGVWRWSLAAALSGVGGAAQGLAWARRVDGPARHAWVPAALAFASAGLLVHAPLPWTDLSVFGAGPAGALAVFVFPLSQAIAGLVARVNPGPTASG